MDNEYIAEYNPSTGAVTYAGEVFTLEQYRHFYQSDTIERLKDLNDNRDISSDLTNLPGNKPYFDDTWYHTLKPRVRPAGYTFELLAD